MSNEHSTEEARPTLTIDVPLVRPLGVPLTIDGVREVWETYVANSPSPVQSIEERMLAAILRSVYAGMLADGQVETPRPAAPSEGGE